MSVSNLLNSNTKIETWSHVYCNVIDAKNGAVETATLGVPPNHYQMPTSIGSVDGRILTVNPVSTNVAAFSDNIIGCLAFGGVANANPRYLVYNGAGNNTAVATENALAQGFAPTKCKVVAITYTSLNGDHNTTQFDINVNGVNNQVIFTSNPMVPGTPYPLASGQFASVSWKGVGTQPNDTVISLWLAKA